MVKCQNCDTELDDGVKFCPNCGSKVVELLEDSNEDKVKTCPNCGKEVDDGVKFCANCGTKVDGSQDSSTVVIPTKFCQGCGKKIDFNATTCPYCGFTSNVTKIKEPILSLVLSLLLPGLGQIYNGEVKKGIIFIILDIVFIALAFIIIGAFLYFILWVYGMYDAYTTAEKINKGEFIQN